MASCSFEKLTVYKLSEQLADDIWNLVLKWPRLAQDTIGKQIIRASDSIGANIAEGSGKVHLQTIAAMYAWLVDRSTKRDTGFVVPFDAGCCRPNTHRVSANWLRS